MATQNELKCFETTVQMKKFRSTNMIERSSICQSCPNCCTFYRVRLWSASRFTGYVFRTLSLPAEISPHTPVCFPHNLTHFSAFRPLLKFPQNLLFFPTPVRWHGNHYLMLHYKNNFVINTIGSLHLLEKLIPVLWGFQLQQHARFSVIA